MTGLARALHYLMRRGEPVPDEPAVEVVDKATSAAFLALLVWVVFIAR